MRDILISRKRWKHEGESSHCFCGLPVCPKERWHIGERGSALRVEGGRDEEPREGGFHRQINTRYFSGWEMRVCLAACLPARLRRKLNFNSEKRRVSTCLDYLLRPRYVRQIRFITFDGSICSAIRTTGVK